MTVMTPTVDVRTRRPVPDKAIFWPGALGFGDPAASTDRTAFPELSEINARITAPSPEPLSVFLEELRGAQERVLILDEYLFQHEQGDNLERFERILAWFPDGFRASEVKLLTSSSASRHVEAQLIERMAARGQEISARNQYANVKIDLNLRLRSHFPLVHDRFAIIDDELWHFGATVGGLHEKVNAASRGWIAEDHNAPAFFKAAWDACQVDIIRHHKRSGPKK